MSVTHFHRDSGDRRPAVPPELPAYLQDVYRLYLPLQEGETTDSLPELATANPSLLGISVVGVDGSVYEVGDSQQDLTVQSISKPFVFGLALEACGRDYVLSRIGVEPTGEPFNSFLEPEELSQRQYNPFVNAGAIAATSMVPGQDFAERYRNLLERFCLFSGREMEVNTSVYESKRGCDNLNRSLAYMMLDFGSIEGNIDEILELYFRQCALVLNCRDLAAMAATLANGGVNPLTGERALAGDYIGDVLSVMYTCGLYDFSGQWAYRVGIPAKSGLAGAIIGVVPHRMGIAVYSPLLGNHGKSERGVRVFEALSNRFQLHVFDRFTGSKSPPRPMMDDEAIANYPKWGATDRLRLANPNLPLANLPNPRQSLMTFREDGDREIAAFLEELHRRYLPLREGKIYTSEPGLVKIDPDWFAIALATVDGQVYSVGNGDEPFLIQSISKIFVYGLALEDRGRDYVLTKVDVEPTGESYDSLIKVRESSKRPFNPMVNTGAISISCLIDGATPAQRLYRILDMYRRYCGHQVFVDTPTLVSEQTGGDRNWAIAYLLRHFGMIAGEIKPILDLYLQQCSAIVNCRDLAVMGATLANNGINPFTGERAIQSRYVKDLLSVMYSCGMYDYAGEWAYSVGFPAKSGVGGGIIGVVPGQMGIAVFSPPLDSRGNSVRGIKVCEELSRHFGLHVFS